MTTQQAALHYIALGCLSFGSITHVLSAAIENRATVD